MNRRSFLRNSLALGLPLSINGMGLAQLPWLAPLAALGQAQDRVLVLVQLIGGNDGLNTLIPLDGYDQLQALRGDIMLPKQQLLPITDTLAFHTKMMGMQNLFQEGKIGIVQDVGYPDQNRSHFRSTDIWTSGSPATETWTSGWLGRYFEEQAPGFPSDYPNADVPHPFALTVGKTVSATCQGDLANFSLAINDPLNLGTVSESEGGEVPNSYYGKQLNFLRNTINQTNAYAEVLKDVAEKGTSVSQQYPDPGSNKLADQLKTVAQLIAGGLQTQVYIVSLGGFDTHSDQVNDGNPEQGRHATLLTQLSQAITAFQDDLALLGLEERVLGMTFSEFGRRIRSNGSFGTDHGTAAPLFLFGSCVRSGSLGINPTFDGEIDNKTGVPMQFDFRNIYGSLLQDWFGLEETTVRNHLFSDYAYLPMVEACSSVATSTKNYWLDQSFMIYPQPVRENLHFRFTNPGGGPVQIDILDIQGRILLSKNLRNLPQGNQEHSLPLAQLSAGTYIARLRVGRAIASKTLIKQ